MRAGNTLDDMVEIDAETTEEAAEKFAEGSANDSDEFKVIVDDGNHIQQCVMRRTRRNRPSEPTYYVDSVMLWV